MTLESPYRRFVVAALMETMPDGHRFARSHWPAHVTLAPNFRTSGSFDQIVEAVGASNPGTISIRFRAVGREHFGPNSDIPVLLVSSDQAELVHHSLARRLLTLPDFVVDEPAHWEQGFRPHLTLRPDFSFGVGDHLVATSIAIAQLEISNAQIVRSFPLSQT